MVTMMQAASQGAALVDDFYRRNVGYAAAVDQYGAGPASAPGLFSSLQQMEQAESQEARAERVDAREAETHEYTMRTNVETEVEDGLLNMVQGLRQARDSGQDLGAAFDSLAGTLPNMGVSEEDIPAMREELLANPDLLDTYYASLTNATEQAQMMENRSKGGVSGDEAGSGGLTKSQVDVTNTVDEVLGYYAELDKLEAIRNTDAGIAESLGRYASSSFLGRQYGKIFSTEAESYRASIEGLRSSLLQAITQAEGMGVRMFDSDRDMQLWLTAVTEPGQDIQTVRRLLRTFEGKYGVGVAGRGGEVQPIQVQNIIDSENYLRDDQSDVDVIYPGFVDPVTGAVFQGGSPGTPTDWLLPEN